MKEKKLPPGMKLVIHEDGRRGYQLRVTGMCPVTRKIRAVQSTEWGKTEAEALAVREKIYQEIIAGGPSAKDLRPTLGEYAKSWLERNAPHIRSGNTLERYQNELVNHILPRFGDWVVDRIRKPDLEKWIAESAKAKYEVPSGKKKQYQAATINGWLRLLKQILQSAAADYELPDPTCKVRPLPEEPVEGNTLRTHEVLAKFLRAARELTPQWYAMMVLGFAIGARKGELRPIRKHEDINFDTGHLIIRRSQNRKHLGKTKNRKIRDLFLPKFIVDILKWHIAYLKAIGHPAADGPLLFPSYGGWRATHRKLKEWRMIDPETGKLKSKLPWKEWTAEHRAAYDRERRRLEKAKKRAAKSLMHVRPTKPADVRYLAPSCLTKPMEHVCEAIGLSEAITSKGMRRTFADLAHKSGVNNLVIQAMAGWQDESIQNRYTSVEAAERCQAIEAVMNLVGGANLVPLPVVAAAVNN